MSQILQSHDNPCDNQLNHQLDGILSLLLTHPRIYLIVIMRILKEFHPQHIKYLSSHTYHHIAILRLHIYHDLDKECSSCNAYSHGIEPSFGVYHKYESCQLFVWFLMKIHLGRKLTSQS